MDPLALEADLPPAARHVAHVLQERGPCTQPELVEITTLPETTVDDALARLANEGSRRRHPALAGCPRPSLRPRHLNLQVPPNFGARRCFIPCGRLF